LKIKFFITPVYPYGNDHYYHEIIAVAEGFRALGHAVFGNADYWWQPESKTYLIPGDNDNNDFDIAIYDYRYVTSFAHLLFRKGYPNFQKDKVHILIDRNDWVQPIWWNNAHYNVFNFIFAGNLYNSINYPANIRPWAIGLTNRIMTAIDAEYNENTVREPVTGYNFRVDHNMRGHVLNQLKDTLKTYPAAERFTHPGSENETDSYYFKASTRRHNPAYYKLLCHTRFFMSFGGYYDFKPLKYQPYSVADKLQRKPAFWKYKALKQAGKDFSDTVFIFQQDNFRFYEVLYSGAIALNLDLEHWNFKLPVMPEAGIHYIGIRNLSAAQVEPFMAALSSSDIQKMSVAGRSWVAEHYSPKAQAMRILDCIEKKA
jgi:hypothetical protein